MLKTRKSVATLSSVVVLLFLFVAVAWGASSGGAAEGEEVYRLSAIYPKTADSTFDMDYYMATHIPLVEELFQPVSVEVNVGVAGAEEGSEPPYAVMTDITFATLEDLQNAVATHGGEVIGDIPNFTNVEAQLQINSSTD